MVVNFMSYQWLFIRMYVCMYACMYVLSLTPTHTTHGCQARRRETHSGRGQAAVRQGEVVRLPPPQELGGEDLAEESAGVLDHAHLDVALMEQLVPHAAAAAADNDAAAAATAVMQGPLARARAELGGVGVGMVVVVPLRHLPQQWLVVFALIELVVVQLTSSSATTTSSAEIHSSVVSSGYARAC